MSRPAGDILWDLILVGGPSGVGKSRLSYPLAKHFDVPIIEVDDLVQVADCVTSLESHPDFHRWYAHPSRFDFSAV